MRLLVFTLCSMLYAAPIQAAESSKFAAEWSIAVERWRTAAQLQSIVGSSLYFIDRGEIAAAEHFGFADLESKRVVDGDTIYHWASITKTLTAVAVMQLVERRILSLNDSVSTYLPEIRKVHNPFGSMDEITIRHLITHSSGFRGSTFPWGGSEEWHPHEPADWSQVAAMMPYTEILFEPGSQYSYSNPGTSMLGRIIEEVTGENVEIYLTKNILMPLGMTRSYFDITPYHLLKHRSNSYFKVDGELVSQGLDFDTGATVANGGLNAPVGDMVKWLSFLLGINDDHANILSRRMLEQMWEPLRPTTDETVSEKMGMVFFVIDHPVAETGESRRYVGHTGGQKGFASFVYVDPLANTAAIFASNTINPEIERPEQLLRLIRKELFENVFPVVGQ